MSAPLYRWWQTKAWAATSRALVRAEGDEGRRETLFDLRDRIRGGFDVVLVCEQDGMPFRLSNQAFGRRRYCSKQCNKAARNARLYRLGRRSA